MKFDDIRYGMMLSVEHDALGLLLFKVVGFVYGANQWELMCVEDGYDNIFIDDRYDALGKISIFNIDNMVKDQ